MSPGGPNRGGCIALAGQDMLCFYLCVQRKLAAYRFPESIALIPPAICVKFVSKV